MLPPSNGNRLLLYLTGLFVGLIKFRQFQRILIPFALAKRIGQGKHGSLHMRNLLPNLIETGPSAQQGNVSE